MVLFLVYDIHCKKGVIGALASNKNHTITNFTHFTFYIPLCVFLLQLYANVQVVTGSLWSHTGH